MDATYLSAKDTAKLVRQALKRAFPAVKFSVRSDTYSGGASIDVRWVDGPASVLVDRVVKPYAGGRFDSSIDMAYSARSWLMPDGTTIVAHDPGTGDQRGSNPGESNDKPHPAAQLVRFGADYVFTHREYTDAFAARVLAKLRRDGWRWEGDEGAIKSGWPQNAWSCRMDAVHNCAAGRETLGDLFTQTRSRFMVAT